MSYIDLHCVETHIFVAKTVVLFTTSLQAGGFVSGMPSWKKQSEAFRQAIKQAPCRLPGWILDAFVWTTVASCKSVS